MRGTVISMKKNQYNDWDEVLSAAARLQGHLPEAVLVGGTASAIFVAHRTSYDADHVLPHLREEFDEILATLESVAGWQTARTKKPVLILGSLNGIETGVRQLIRTEPLETTDISIRGQTIKVPTEGEILRIKGALILKRNATRDYLDFAALSRHLGIEGTSKALERLDELYPQPSGESALHQLYIQLATPKPFDLESVSLATYKNLSQEWQNWGNVAGQCKQAACALLDHSLGLVENLEQQAQEVKVAQAHMVEAGATYDALMKEYIGAKGAQCERLEVALANHVAAQRSRVAKCDERRPGRVSSLWRGHTWRKDQAREHGRLNILERRLSRVQGIKADVRQLECMAEAKLRRERRELATRRDAELRQKREAETQEKQRLIQASRCSSVSRGRTLGKNLL